LNLAPIVYKPDTLDRSRVSLVADYARSLSHGLAVFPTGDPGFSLNFDGTYDFTSYWWDNHHTRMVFAGGAEYTVRNLVPLRLGGYWDGRGRGKDDDRGYIAGGIGFFRARPRAPSGSTSASASPGRSPAPPPTPASASPSRSSSTRAPKRLRARVSLARADFTARRA
jgi:hypothetical protein